MKLSGERIPAKNIGKNICLTLGGGDQTIVDILLHIHPVIHNLLAELPERQVVSLGAPPSSQGRNRNSEDFRHFTRGQKAGESVLGRKITADIHVSLLRESSMVA